MTKHIFSPISAAPTQRSLATLQVQRKGCSGICCVCWRRSACENRLPAKHCWETEAEMRCCLSNSCEILPAHTFSTVTSSLFLRRASRISPALTGSKQAHERCPSVRCKLTHAHQLLKAEAHTLRMAFQWLHWTSKAENMCVYCTLPSGQSVRPVCGGKRFKESSFTPENQIIAKGLHFIGWHFLTYQA